MISLHKSSTISHFKDDAMGGINTINQICFIILSSGEQLMYFPLSKFKDDSMEGINTIFTNFAF